MEITTKLVNHLAQLSRIEFDDAETENFKHEFEETMKQMDMIESVDTAGIEKKCNTLDAETELEADEAHQGLTKQDAIKNAPETMGSSIAVPMMVE